jgi:MerR family transcriptional regulator, redox-sensitive transcriptional activator SoxR
MTKLKSTTLLSIGECAQRAGVAVSALRFYEERGLVASRRSAGGQRIYPRASLRRIAFVRAAQAVGLSLDDIANALATLPESRTPTAADWAKLSAQWCQRWMHASPHSLRCAII